MRHLPVLIGFLFLALTGPVVAQEQMGDPDFQPRVARPAYGTDGPTVLLDEAHGSVQTATGRYAGFIALARADGYEVRSNPRRFEETGVLDGVDVLVISNAAAPRDGSDTSAFTAAEIAAIEAWVRAGGALLLAVDHAPHGTAAQALGRALGVEMGKGYAFAPNDGDPETNLMFSRQAGTLGDHPILDGRDPTERVERVKTFTGQSLTGPDGATVLLAMAPGDREATDLPTLKRVNDAFQARPTEAQAVLDALTIPARPAQGLAFTHGQGRVVVLGEAGMLTAQIVRFPPEQGREALRFGLQTEGHDDQAFVLNTLRWLSGLIP